VRGIEDLASWVEQGAKPAGEDLLADDLTDLGRDFTVLPMFQSVEADAVPGANRRLTLGGTFTLDGEPLAGADTWVEVMKDGLVRTCSYWAWFPTDGQYYHEVAADAETAGCGQDGARAYFIMYSWDRRQYYVAQEALDWPSGPNPQVMFDASFSSDDPVGAGVGATVEDFLGALYRGVVLDAAGEPMPPDTLVEAYVGDTRCGAYALPVVSMDTGGSEAASYYLRVSGPELIPACTRGEPVEFRVNGEPVPQTGVNTVEYFATELDLQLKE
jgi:hypothetical protein